jgi:hypothetical protein
MQARLAEKESEKGASEAEKEEAVRKLQEQRALEAKNIKEQIANLEKRNLELQSNWDIEKEQLKLKLETAKADQERLKFTTAEVEKKRNRLEELNEEIKKLVDEHTQKCQKLESEFKLSEVAAQADAKTLKENVELLEKEKADSEIQFAGVIQDLENEIRNYKSEAVKEISKLTGIINQLTTEKDILKREHETAKEKLNLIMTDAKTSAHSDIEKLREKILQNETEIKQLSEQYSQEENELEAELFQIFVKTSSVSEELEAEIEKLRKEKSEIAEQNLVALQKKQRELFEKESTLKKEVDALKSQQQARVASTAVQVIHLDQTGELTQLKTEIERLQKEKLLLEEQHKQERGQFMQKNLEEQERLEKLIQAEKVKREDLEKLHHTQKSKLETDLQKEVQKKSEEVKSLSETLATLEKEKLSTTDSHKHLRETLEEEISKIKSTSAINNMQLQNKIAEISAQKANLIEDREKLRQTLQEQIQTLKSRFDQEHSKLEKKYLSHAEENQQLLSRQKEAQTARDLVVSSLQQQQSLLSPELEALKTMFTTTLDQLVINNTELSKDKISLEREIDTVTKYTKDSEKRWKIEEAELRVQTLKTVTLKSRLDKELSVKISDLEKKLDLTLTQNEIEIKQLKKKLEEEGPDVELKERLEALTKEAEQQKEHLSKLEKEIEALTAKKAAQAPPATVESPSNTVSRKAHRRTTVRTMRLAPVDPPFSVEEELEKLRNVMLKIMTGENIVEAELSAFGQLFKLDQGRRVFTFLLKEYSESPEDDGPVLLSSASFNSLKILIDLVLDSIDLRNGGDFINGKILLETSSVIGRPGPSGQPEFIQELIRSNKCWQNTFFWQEYFWAQTTAKFGDQFGEGANSSKGWNDSETAFWEKEISAFAKVMYNWGDLPFGKLLLFVESLTDATLLGLESRSRVLKTIQDFHQKEQQRFKSGYRQSRLFASTAPQPAPDKARAGRKQTRVLKLGRPISESDESNAPKTDEATSPKTDDSTKSPLTSTVSNPRPSQWRVPTNTQKTPSPVVVTIGKGSDETKPPATTTPTITIGSQETINALSQSSARRMAARSIVVNFEVQEFIQGMLRGPK